MKAHLPEPMKRLVKDLAEWPSIGPRQARRLVFYLVRGGQDALKRYTADFDDLRKIKICEQCFFVHQNSDSLCEICRNPQREQGLIAIVEKETDLLALEATASFHGRYLIIGDLEKTGILEEVQKLRLQSLKQYIQKKLHGQAEEVILALNPTRAGDAYVEFITKELRPLTRKISRLAIGLPRGGEIEFADEETLGESLAHRQ